MFKLGNCTMDLSILESLDKSELIELVRKQGKTITELREELKLAFDKIVSLERASKRQAAPFRIEDKKRKKDKKRPGNKPRHKGYFRKFEGKVDQTVDAPLEKCPICQHDEFEQVEQVEQIVEEIQATKKVTKLITYQGTCTHCKNVVSSDHPIKISNAKGAASTYIGSMARSLALELNYKYGLSKRKTVAVMEKIFGIKISPGGLVHMGHKAAKVLKEPYEDLKQRVRTSDVIHADETSWYVSDPKYWLWVFANKNLTLYHVIRSRARAVIQSILGENYAGVLVSDCLNIYDDVNQDQQKCYSHHLKAISTAEQFVEDSEKDKVRLEQIKSMLKTAMVIKKTKDKVTDKQYRAAIKHLQNQADDLIPELEQIKKQVEDQTIEFQESTIKVLNRFSRQKDHLFTFMDYDQVDATNNLAERQLRPAVISRKISCGNRSDKGADTWQTLVSLMQTFIQQGKSFEEILTRSYRQAIIAR